MVLGVGIDLIALARAEQLWQRYGDRLKDDLLTAAEYDALCTVLERSEVTGQLQTKGATHFLASRLAAKEAAVKAIGAPHAIAYDWCDLEVTGDSDITVRLGNRLQEFADMKGCSRLTGSVHANSTHCLAIIIGESQ